MLTSNIRQNLEKKRYAALHKWTETLESVHGAVVAKMSSNRNMPDVGGVPPEFLTHMGRGDMDRY